MLEDLKRQRVLNEALAERVWNAELRQMKAMLEDLERQRVLNAALAERVLNAELAEMRADIEAMAVLRQKIVGTATGEVTDVNGHVQVSSANDRVQGKSTDGGAPVRSPQDTEMRAEFEARMASLQPSTKPADAEFATRMALFHGDATPMPTEGESSNFVPGPAPHIGGRGGRSDYSSGLRDGESNLYHRGRGERSDYSPWLRDGESDPDWWSSWQPTSRFISPSLF